MGHPVYLALIHSWFERETCKQVVNVCTYTRVCMCMNVDTVHFFWSLVAERAHGGNDGNFVLRLLLSRVHNGNLMEVETLSTLEIVINNPMKLFQLRI